VSKLATRLVQLGLGFIALAFCAAPVPGDAGGCGQSAQELDPQVFFASFQDSECQQCKDCEIETAACRRACDDALVQSAFPKDCVPLVHDGEVCLRAIQQSSCGDARDFMSDSSPSIPTECNFCPAGGSP
jgi:hypothetical protein